MKKIQDVLKIIDEKLIMKAEYLKLKGGEKK